MVSGDEQSAAATAAATSCRMMSRMAASDRDLGSESAGGSGVLGCVASEPVAICQKRCQVE